MLNADKQHHNPPQSLEDPDFLLKIEFLKHHHWFWELREHRMAFCLIRPIPKGTLNMGFRRRHTPSQVHPLRSITPSGLPRGDLGRGMGRPVIIPPVPSFGSSAPPTPGTPRSFVVNESVSTLIIALHFQLVGRKLSPRNRFSPTEWYEIERT